jgi:hypothetical protein
MIDSHAKIQFLRGKFFCWDFFGLCISLGIEPMCILASCFSRLKLFSVVS